MQDGAQHSLPAAFSHSFPLFWDPQAETDELPAEGVTTGAPLLHTWDTEHAPTSSLARFQEKKSFPESRLGMSQQWMSFILDQFQSISTQKGIKQ